ncbi:hypothetical protein [Bradyrhizobium sp. CB3481]|uniref:hypothetical protein n=1 Tax=Bradyrhizobium sp. CB3481 TaxID=3039158 RepID=UPI0024B1E5F3|nr:hypothetical protein [Bradyrhizobium sp. CB3481]WFU17727.1 hypothetical protein QA643_05080 [Bradyrhizobium sp. CB3481]
MARFPSGDQPDADTDLPIGDVASPPVAPASPSPTLPEETQLPNQPAARPIGSGFSDLGATSIGTAPPAMDASPQGVADPGAVSPAPRTNDLAMVQNNLLAELHAGQFSGAAALGHVQAILSDITSAISAANATTGVAGALVSAAGAQQTLRATSIINAVSTDTALANPTPDAPAPTAPATPHSLAEIGALFDDVASQILGGVTDDNRTQITDDINTVISDIQALMKADPKLFDGLTGAHADQIVQQLQLELAYINDPEASPTAAQASSDNIHDIIEVIQADTKLADMVTPGGISSTPALPDAAGPGPNHLDSPVETALVANFIAQSNALGKQATDLVGSQDGKAIAALIDDLRAFEKAAGELDGTLGGEIAAMIKGLQTGNAALVTAAADQMHGNATDIGGHSVPVTGGTYNTDGVTVAEVLGTPAAPPTAETPTAAEPAAFATADITAPANVDDHSPAPEVAHLHHMWG